MIFELYYIKEIKKKIFKILWQYNIRYLYNMSLWNGCFHCSSLERSNSATAHYPNTWQASNIFAADEDSILKSFVLNKILRNYDSKFFTPKAVHKPDAQLTTSPWRTYELFSQANWCVRRCVRSLKVSSYWSILHRLKSVGKRFTSTV